jgi:hypothetical protein
VIEINIPQRADYPNLAESQMGSQYPVFFLTCRVITKLIGALGEAPKRKVQLPKHR